MKALVFSDNALWVQGSCLGPRSPVGRRPRLRRLVPTALLASNTSRLLCFLRPWPRLSDLCFSPAPLAEECGPEKASLPPLVARTSTVEESGPGSYSLGPAGPALPFFGGAWSDVFPLAGGPGPGSSLFPTRGPGPHQGRHEPGPALRFGPGCRRAHSALLWWGGVDRDSGVRVKVRRVAGGPRALSELFLPFLSFPQEKNSKKLSPTLSSSRRKPAERMGACAHFAPKRQFAPRLREGSVPWPAGMLCGLSWELRSPSRT